MNCKKKTATHLQTAGKYHKLGKRDGVPQKERGESERAREREPGEREREREREREAGRQADRETDRQTDRQMDRKRENVGGRMQCFMKKEDKSLKMLNILKLQAKGAAI